MLISESALYARFAKLANYLLFCTPYDMKFSFPGLILGGFYNIANQ